MWVRGIVPGIFLNSSLLYESFSTLLESENKPSSLKTKFRGIVPGKNFQFCRRVLVHFRGIKTNFPSLKQRSGVLSPGNFLKSALRIGEFWYFSEKKNKLSRPLKRGSGVLSPGKFLEFCVAVGEFQYIFEE